MSGNENALAIALQSLEKQKIAVSPGIVGPNGLVFDVMGFMLTGKQIIGLKDCGLLSAKGIEEFAKSVEGDANAATAMPGRKFRKP